MEPILSDRHAAFVDAYLRTKNATQSCIEAGYSPKSAGVMACKLLDGKTHPEVYRAVRIGMMRLEMTAIRKAEEVLRYIHTCMFFEPLKFFEPGDDGGWLLSPDQYNNLPPEIGCLIEEVEHQTVVVTKPDGGTVTQSRYWVRLVSKTAMVKLAAQAQLIAKGSKGEQGQVQQPAPMTWDSLYGRERVADPVTAKIEEMKMKVIESKTLKPPPNPMNGSANGKH